MNKKEEKYEPVVSFKEQTPKMLLGVEERKQLYEEAYFSSEEKSKTEYAQNTTTWD
ncbi:MAG: hypothetical protein J6K04_12060 [Lachnospiraceae bacterium]|nr:hypothetical protein [Lachnospiraceae bacterium]